MVGLAFHRIQAIHFARLAVIEEAEFRPALGPKRSLPAALVLSLVFDGTKVECVEQLIEVARRELDVLYASCEGYPGPKADKAAVRDYFLAHDIPPFVFYRGVHGATVSAVKKTAALYDQLRTRLDARLKYGTAETATSLARELRPRPPVIGSDELPPALPEMSKGEVRWRVAAWSLIVASPFLAVSIAFGLTVWSLGLSGEGSVIAGLSPLLFVVAWLLFSETRDAAGAREAKPVARGSSNARMFEDVSVQNALTHCVVVKPGALRWLLLRIVFWAIRRRVELVDRHVGSLGGIASIHFARWVPLDGGARLLFLSDYDGSWESYLAEFVDRASAGLSSIWSNTVGFPATRLLVFRGARDEDRFKKWTRENQMETPIWYSAYPEYTVANVLNDLRVAQLLATDKPTPADPAWLALL